MQVSIRGGAPEDFTHLAVPGRVFHWHLPVASQPGRLLHHSSMGPVRPKGPTEEREEAKGAASPPPTNSALSHGLNPMKPL